MTSKLVFISDVTDIDIIPESILNNSTNKIFSFTLDAHKALDLKKINHDLADDILDKNERLKIFDKCLDFFSWHSEIPSKDLELDGVNLLKLFDSHEFHSFLMPILMVNYNILPLNHLILTFLTEKVL